MFEIGVDGQCYCYQDYCNYVGGVEIIFYVDFLVEQGFQY